MWLLHRAAARGAQGLFGRALRARPLVYIGTISYGIYLLHFFVLPVAARIEDRFHISLPVPNDRGIGQFLFLLIVSMGAAGLSWRFFEGPLNSLKTYFPYVPRVRSIKNDAEMPTS